MRDRHVCVYVLMFLVSVSTVPEICLLRVVVKPPCILNFDPQ